MIVGYVPPNNVVSFLRSAFSFHLRSYFTSSPPGHPVGNSDPQPSNSLFLTGPYVFFPPPPGRIKFYPLAGDTFFLTFYSFFSGQGRFQGQFTFPSFSFMPFRPHKTRFLWRNHSYLLVAWDLSPWAPFQLLLSSECDSRLTELHFPPLLPLSLRTPQAFASNTPGLPCYCFGPADLL